MWVDNEGAFYDPLFPSFMDFFYILQNVACGTYRRCYITGHVYKWRTNMFPVRRWNLVLLLTNMLKGLISAN